VLLLLLLLQLLFQAAGSFYLSAQPVTFGLNKVVHLLN